MRLATVFDSDSNEPRPVFELPGGERIDLRELFNTGGEPQLDTLPLYFTDLTTSIQHLDDVIAAVRAWATQRAESAGRPGASPLESRMTRMPFCPPIPAPRSVRIFDTFEQHVARRRIARGALVDVPAAWYEAPAFSFSNAGSLIGHESAVSAPRGCGELDFGFQLGIVIGRGGRNIAAEDAWKHVAGFTIINDFAARDLEQRELEIGMGPSKSKDFATAVGPYLATLDAMRDRIDSQGRTHLAMVARINGKEVSRGNSAAMYFSWPALVEHASRDAELFAGDILGSGCIGGGSIIDLGVNTAGGWLEAGDVVELDVERLGTLRTPIIRHPELNASSRKPVGSTTAAV